MKPQFPRTPHFLRVTQALALVSGIGAPCAAMLIASADCGSNAPTPGAGTCGDACVATGVGAPADGAVLFYDGQAIGVVLGPPTGVSPPPRYDGGPMGVVIGPGGGVMPAPDGSTSGPADATASDADMLPSDAAFKWDGIHVIGGPLPPPDLPALLA